MSDHERLVWNTGAFANFFSFTATEDIQINARRNLDDPRLDSLFNQTLSNRFARGDYGIAKIAITDR